MDDTTSLEMGDTVRLKFGGPEMTVLSVSEDHCCCMWFGERGKFEHGAFEKDFLAFVDRPAPLLPRDARFTSARPGPRA